MFFNVANINIYVYIVLIWTLLLRNLKSISTWIQISIQCRSLIINTSIHLSSIQYTFCFSLLVFRTLPTTLNSLHLSGFFFHLISIYYLLFLNFNSWSRQIRTISWQLNIDILLSWLCLTLFRWFLINPVLLLWLHVGKYVNWWLFRRVSKKQFIWTLSWLNIHQRTKLFFA